MDIRKLKIIGVAALIVFAIPVLMTVLQQISVSRNQENNVEPAAVMKAVTTVIDHKGEMAMLFKGKAVQVSLGSKFGAGLIELQKGALDLQFTDGAVVRIQAPCRLEIASGSKCTLVRGSATAYVTKRAYGFVMNGAKFNVVDLGTQFGMYVAASGHTEVHVFEGKVKLDVDEKDESLQDQVVGAGKALIVDAEDMVEETQSKDDQFKALLDKSADYMKWQSYVAKLREDSDVVFYLGLDGNENTDKSIDQLDGIQGALNTRHSSLKGGRYDEKKSRRFNGRDGYVGLDVKEGYKAFSLATWVKFSDKKIASLLMSNGHGHVDGDVRWFYRDNGDLLLSISQLDGGGKSVDQRYESSGSLWRSSVEQWVHLAVTYDQGAGEVVHYINGAKVSKHSMGGEFNLPVRVGKARIGSWDSKGFTSGKRPFHGLIGEMVMFKRALTAQEIRQMYKNSHPKTASL